MVVWCYRYEAARWLGGGVLVLPAFLCDYRSNNSAVPRPRVYRETGMTRRPQAGSPNGPLRNSTKIAAQFSGLGQCSQKFPETPGKLKTRPYCSHRPNRQPSLCQREFPGPASQADCFYGATALPGVGDSFYGLGGRRCEPALARGNQIPTPRPKT